MITSMKTRGLISVTSRTPHVPSRFSFMIARTPRLPSRACREVSAGKPHLHCRRVPEKIPRVEAVAGDTQAVLSDGACADEDALLQAQAALAAAEAKAAAAERELATLKVALSKHLAAMQSTLWE